MSRERKIKIGKQLCKDCLHFEACVAFMYSEFDSCKTTDECKEKHANDDVCDLFMPAADVVPRAEVDKWFRECEELQGRLIELKKEVAREIFEEIEKSVAALEYRANTPRKTVNVEELKAQCDWILHEVIPKILTELKKKYIGDKQRKEDEGKWK